MKKMSLLTVAVSALFLASPMAMAGGAGCDKSKGHAKELSAEAMKEHRDNHAWMFGDKEHGTADALISEKEVPADAQKSKSEKVIGI